MSEHPTYRDAGVDIDLASNLLGGLKQRLSHATRPEVLSHLGSFGGLFQLDLSRFSQPVLVASIDGVGTKPMIAELLDSHVSVGHDIVNHCVNDVAVQGAEPLFFLDYVGIRKLRNPLYSELLTGIAEACEAQQVALLGGETAEMPGVYDEHFDLVGCIVGCADRERLITGERIAPGNLVIGLASNGLHTNGYSLARKVLLGAGHFRVEEHFEELGETLGKALARPHRCYWPVIRAALQRRLPVLGMAHITGGGWYDNLPRVLPEGLGADLDPGAMPPPPLFQLLQRHGEVTPAEMYHVFNMGVGLMWVVAPEDEHPALALAAEEGVPAAVIGRVTDEPGVRLKGIVRDA